ncbi:MAG: thioredoxin [Lachnospiraceae bacterium]|nr:thioredoxin [Lachnospiraceae bacterium]
MVEKITNNDMSKALNAKVAVVDFSATWCGPCQMLAPLLEELSQELTDVKFFNADTDENTELAIRNGISNIPALLLLKDGQVVDRHIGFAPKQQLKEWINK